MPAGADEPRRRAGYRDLERRMRELPAMLRAAAREEPPPRLDLGALRGIVTTGLGSSAAHARFLAALIAERCGHAARYVPASALIGPPPAHAAAEALVVVSQGLSPNARLVLASRGAWRHVVLMTATGDAGAGGDEKVALLAELRAAGVEVRRFCAGENEYGTLVRVVGPMAGYLCALRFVEGLAPSPRSVDVDAIADAVAVVPGRVARFDPPLDPAWLATDLALLTSGTYGELVDNLRYKVLEGMLLPAPPVWDLLHVAHGPFQQAHDRPATFLALTRPDAPREPELLARLSEMLDPARHRLVRLPATLPGPLAVFEHEAFLNELMLRYIDARGIDQAAWPGLGKDAPLYRLGEGHAGAACEGPVTRRLEHLTWPELAALLAAGPCTAVVPLGSTEQHGPHLPYATDTWIAGALAERFCARIGEAIQCPTVAVGCSREHLAFPGTLDLRDSTFTAVLVDLVASLRAHGFAHAFVFSAHGGNCAPLRAALPELRAAAAPMRVIAFTDLARLTATFHEASAGFGVAPEASGHHAGELETSIVYGLRPHSVRENALAAGYVDSHPDPQALFYPSLRTHAPSGTVGDPRAASGSRAARYLDVWTDLLVDAYRREKKKTP